MDHPRGVPAIEGLQAKAYPRAATGTLRHHRQSVERACRIALLHRIRHMRELGVEQKCLGFVKFVEHAVDETDENCGVHAHRAGSIEKHHKP